MTIFLISLVQGAIVFIIGAAESSSVLTGIISGIFMIINTLIMLMVRDRWGKNYPPDYEEEDFEDHDYRKRRRARAPKRGVEERRKAPRRTKKESGETSMEPRTDHSDS